MKTHNPLIGFIALLVPNLWKIPKVYHFHSSWFDEERINSLGKKNFLLGLNFKLQLIRIIEWTCYKFSGTIIFLSEYSKKRFENYFYFSKPNLLIIPGGVDLKEFQPLRHEENLHKIRGLLSLEKKQPVILTVRRLEEIMGLENLVLAVEMLIKKLPKAKGFKDILYPGERKNFLYKKNIKRDIAVPSKILQEMKELNAI